MKVYMWTHTRNIQRRRAMYVSVTVSVGAKTWERTFVAMKDSEECAWRELLFVLQDREATQTEEVNPR